MSYCKDCRYFVTVMPRGFAECYAPQGSLKPDMIYGHVSGASCHDTRNDPKKCGPDARWFMPKEPPRRFFSWLTKG